uniref:FHA domain-containing protein n=1 Tax=Ciona savignyi TaxID=51511 RepID=H2YXT6_CIOSA
MPLYGKIYVIRRNGTDGSQFPLTSRSCLFGRRLDCDIRIQLPTVSNEHCRLEAGENGEFELQNLSPNQTKVNGDLLKGSTIVRHKDVFTIHDRSFRFEYPENTAFYKTPAKETTKNETPGKKTPLREIQASNPGNDSPFGALVKDMKKSLKSTPKKSKPKSSVENAENYNSGKKKKERKSIDKRKSKSPATQTNTNPQDAVAIPCENTADLANINEDSNKTTVTSVLDDNSN